MATIKVACPKCGQKVSGDEGFYGTSVECPICSADILFPGKRPHESPGSFLRPVPPEQPKDSSFPSASLPGDKRAVPDTQPDAVPFPAGRAELPVESPVQNPAAVAASALGDEDDGPMLPPSPIYGAIAIVSAVLGVVTCVGAILFAPMAIIFGHIALAKARHSPVQPAPGHTLGAIGLMIGYVSLVLTILILLAATFFGDAIREAIQQARS